MAAGVLEIVRKQDIAENGGFPQEVAGKIYTASHLTILLQTPQFLICGAGEVFSSITGTSMALLAIFSGWIHICH